MDNSKIYLALIVNVVVLLAVVLLLMSGADVTQMAMVAVGMALTLVVPIALLNSRIAAEHAKVVAKSNELAETQKELAQAKKQVQEAATLDDLTGAYNKRHFENLITHHSGLAARGNYVFCICTIQIDAFDELVEKFSRAKGDDVLRLFTSIVKSALREVDSVARLSGAKFGLMLSGAIEAEAILAIKRTAVLISQIQVSEDFPDFRLSTSTGLTAYDESVSSEEMLANAEHALGYAISQGGDRIAAHTHGDTDPGNTSEPNAPTDEPDTPA